MRMWWGKAKSGDTWRAPKSRGRKGKPDRQARTPRTQAGRHMRMPMRMPPAPKPGQLLLALA